MQKTYKLSIIYFVVFTILLLVSANILFIYKIGFSIDSILSYYIGDSERYIEAKSISGILKLTLPHIFSFALLAMVLLHFMVFTKQRHNTKTKLLVYTINISAFFEIFSAFLIIWHIEFFAYIKIFSLFVFEISIFYLLYMLVYSIIYKN